MDSSDAEFFDEVALNKKEKRKQKKAEQKQHQVLTPEKAKGEGEPCSVCGQRGGSYSESAKAWFCGMDCVFKYRSTKAAEEEESRVPEQHQKKIEKGFLDIEEFQSYADWYCTKIKKIGPIKFEELLKKQGLKCAITGVDFVLKPGDPKSPHLRINKYKPWLPENELVCWVFRHINFDIGYYAGMQQKAVASPVKTKRGVYVSSEDEDQWY